MNSMPTYKDFRYSNIGNVVRTDDGRFFVITNSKLFRYLFRGVFIVILAAAGFATVWPDILGLDLWPNSTVFDLPFVLLLLHFSVARIYYRFADFAELHEDHPEYREAVKLFEPSIRKPKQRAINNGQSVTAKTVSVVITVLILLFALLNSHSAQLVRSLFDRPRLVSVDIIRPGAVVLSEDGSDKITVMTVPSNTGMLDLIIVVARTAETAEFALDGSDVKDDFTFRDKALSLFWQPDYLKRRYDLDLTGIRDGSTLTLTCGDLHQEWVFDIQEGDNA